MHPSADPRFDSLLCRQCRGRCCRAHPGAWVDPGRFRELFFSGGLPAIDRLPAALLPLDLELRDFSGVPVPVPRGTAAGCVFLGPAGCRLPPDRRPCQCLALEPSLDTLLDDLIHCRLPPGMGFGTVRGAWRRFWAGRLAAGG